MGATTGKGPKKVTYRVAQAAVAQAATALTLAFIAPFPGALTAVKFVPVTGITGAATNNRVHAVYNRGQAGAGTTKMADLIYDSGVNSVTKVPRDITLHATVTNRDAVAGDVIEVESKFQASGIADAGGIWELTFSRD